MNEYIPLLLAVVTAVVAPCLLAYLNSRNTRAEKLADAIQHRVDQEADWARADALATRTETTAIALAAKNEATTKAAAAQLAEQQENVAQEMREHEASKAEKVLATSQAVTGKLEVIHKLVNSNMTAMMQQALDAMIRELALLHELIDLKRSIKIEPTEAVLATVTATEERIAEMHAAIADRLQVAP